METHVALVLSSLLPLSVRLSAVDRHSRVKARDIKALAPKVNRGELPLRLSAAAVSPGMPRESLRLSDVAFGAMAVWPQGERLPK